MYILIDKQTRECISFIDVTDIGTYINKSYGTITYWLKKGYKETDSYILCIVDKHIPSKRGGRNIVENRYKQA